jgi:tetratricopeptide (TPR) repeat protein
MLIFLNYNKGTLAESMGEMDKAMKAYENALAHNPSSVPALTQIATLCRSREEYPRAVDLFQRVLAIDRFNGEIWGALGHCCLMMDDLQNAYQAYQQALNYLSNPKVCLSLNSCDPLARQNHAHICSFYKNMMFYTGAKAVVRNRYSV